MIAGPGTRSRLRLVRRALFSVVGLAAAAALAACTSGTGSEDTGAGPQRQEGLALEAVSTLPDYVTGGDVLVEVSGEGLEPASVTLEVDGVPVDVAWNPTPRGVRGLVEGLPEGPSVLVARHGTDEASLEVSDHSFAGPLFSGPHLPLVDCVTESYGLGAADEDCMVAAPAVEWSYVNEEGERLSLEDPTSLPDDVATMADGETPFVLREERGTLNRAVYWITVPDPRPDPDGGWDPDAFNGRLVYAYGGGCGVTYAQGFSLAGPPDLELLAEGYAHATATFNTFQVTCNPVLSAETTLMVKERFAEAYEPPELTIGTGGSGGAIQQLLIVQSFPGLLDAASPLLPFPDAVSIATDVLDCGLLQRYQRESETPLGPDAYRAVTGHLDAATCLFWEQAFVPNVDPTVGCGEPGAVEGPTAAYHPETNPEGLRCTLQDGNVHVLGTDPATGFARRPWDNVGVAYGLEALRDGTIGVEELLDLNEGIGSFDLDGRWTPERAAADAEAIRVAYEAGAVLQGLGDLGRIPIVLVDLWSDHEGDIHTRDRAFTIRERVRNGDGSLPPGVVLWTRGLPEGTGVVGRLTGSVSVGPEAVRVLDEWATALAELIPDRADADDATLAEALAASRPPDAEDNCLTADGERISGPDLYERPGPCTDPYPVSSTPRRVAGAPLVHDILKCTLVPVVDVVDAELAEVPFTDEQLLRLEAIFPEGMCDWSRPGVGQAPMATTWPSWGS